MLKSKISERVQEVILPDFPDDENTVPTVTKSRRVSFGTNFVKEFIVGSAVSGECLAEYEHAFPSSDSSNADSSHSVAENGVLEQSMFAPQEAHKVHKQVCQPEEADFPESRPKIPKFSSTVCFSADSPTADMEFTEGCITLAKSILDKKNKEMTVIIQAKPKDEQKPKEDETKYFDGSHFEMSMTRCLKTKGNKREEKRFDSEKTKIFSKYENEMSITRCNKVFNEDDSDASWEDSKENRMPLDMIMRHLDNDDSDLEKDLFNPEKPFGDLFTSDPTDFTNESEKLNLNESMDISTDFHSRGPRGVNFSQNMASPQGRSRNEGQVCAAVSYEGAPATGGIDKSTEEMSLDDAEPFQRPQSPPCVESADCRMNKSTELQESEDVQVPQREESVVDPGTGEDKINKSTQQMSLDACREPDLPEAETIMIDERTEQKEPECEREPSLLDLRSNYKITEQNTVDVTSGTDAKSNQSTERTSFDSISMPENRATEDGLAAGTCKSPERMSLDGSNEMLPTEIIESLVDPVCGEKMNKSASEKRTNLDGSEEVVRCETEPSLLDLPPTDKMKQSTEERMVEPSFTDKINQSTEERMTEPLFSVKICESTEPKMVGPPFDNKINELIEQKMVEPSSIDKISESTEQMMIDLLSVDKTPERKLPEAAETEASTAVPTSTGKTPIGEEESLDEEMSTTEREPSLVDVKVIESLREQSKEPGCVWFLKDIRHPQNKAQGWLSFNCKLLESTTGIYFALKTSNEGSLIACSLVTNSEISLAEEKQFRLPEYRLVVDFGFEELKKYFDERRTKVETIRHVPYFLDQINLFMTKMNASLRQIHSVLTLYPGSRLEGSRLSFRLFSFPIFFSCVVSIDLSNYFRLSKSSLSFETDFGSLDENKIREIFESCLKCENSLCEFVTRSTKYLIDLERETGYVSKRGHIRLLPDELRL